MTKEQKIEMLASESNVMVLYRIRWATLLMEVENEETRTEAGEDFQLAMEEALRRMGQR